MKSSVKIRSNVEHGSHPLRKYLFDLFKENISDLVTPISGGRTAEKLLNTKEACLFLDISRYHLKKLVEMREIQCLKIPTCYAHYYRLSELSILRASLLNINSLS